MAYEYLSKEELDEYTIGAINDEMMDVWDMCSDTDSKLALMLLGEINGMLLLHATLERKMQKETEDGDNTRRV